MFSWIGLAVGVFVGSSLGVAGGFGAVSGWLIFGLMGWSLGKNIDNWLSSSDDTFLVDRIESEKEQSLLYESEISSIRNSYEYRRLLKSKLRVRLIIIPLAILMGWCLVTFLPSPFSELKYGPATFWISSVFFFAISWGLLELIRTLLFPEHRLLHEMQNKLGTQEEKLKESREKLRELGVNDEYLRY